MNWLAFCGSAPRRFGLLGAVVLAWGCTGDQTPGPPKLDTVPAAGTVTYGGAPLANASVTFQALSGAVAAHGTTDAQGAYTLTTYASNDGAPPGQYRVIVAVSAVQEIEPGVLAPEPPGGFQSPIPLMYADPSRSGLAAEVPAGGSEDLKIELP